VTFNSSPRRESYCIAGIFSVIKVFMQISRRFLLACIAAIFLNPFLLRAADTEAQIRARQALEEKMKQLDMQAATSAPPVVVVKPPPPVKKAKTKPQPPAKVTKSKTPATTPAPPAVLVTPGEPPHEVAPAQPAPPVMPAVQEPVVTAPPTAPSIAPAPVVSTPEIKAPEMTPAPPPPVNSADDEKVREALRQKMLDAKTTGTTNQTSQPWAQPFVTSTNNNNRAYRAETPANPQPSFNLPPLTGPPSTLSAAKQQRLEQLLQLYRADQITPQEYHEQRAKILAEP
jgi:hypothetical protein